MRMRPVAAASAALALLAGAATGPVLAAVGSPADGPASGAATSSLTLLDVALGERSASVLELALRSDTLGGAPATSFVLTPLTLDGTTYGRQSLASRSGVLPSVDTRLLAPATVTALAAVRTPDVDVTSENGTSHAGTTSLGAYSVLGLPLALEGTASITAAVDGAGASGGKTLKVSRLTLPSIADLVAALGLDLTELPTGTLTDLLDGLDLDTPATDAVVAELESALAAVQPQVDAASDALADAGAAVEQATAELDAATTALAPVAKALNDATRDLTGPTGGLRVASLIGGLPIVDDVLTPLEPVLGPTPAPVVDLVDEVEQVVDAVDPVVDPVLDEVSEVVAPVVTPVVPVVEAVLPLPELPVTLPTELQPLVDIYDAARSAYDAALADVTDARAALDAATQLLADTQAALDALLAPVTGQVTAVVEAVVAVLDATPLVALDRLEVTTRSTVTSAADGGQRAEVVGGEVEGLRVLGTDVLDEVVGSSEVDVLDLTSPVQQRLEGVIDGLTGTLSGVLSSVPGLPGLQVPAPTVDLLSSAAVTDVVDGFGVAGSALRALNVTWSGIRVPAAVAVPPAGAGGALRTAAVGDVVAPPLSLSIATLEERARFRPSVTSAAPGTGTPGTGTPGTGTPGTGTGAPTTGAPPTTGTPSTGTPPTTGTPTTGTPTTGTPPGTGTPDTGNPPTTPVGLTQLPRTGLDTEPSLLALLLVAAALGLHRRYRTA